jgi:hypothetical protein
MKESVEARELQHLTNLPLGRHEQSEDAVPTEATIHIHEQSQPGRINKVQELEVKDKFLGPDVIGLLEGVLHPGRCM